MNKIILVGRLTADPELRTTTNGTAVCSFSVACDRRFQTSGGERQADFINCVAWRQSAEFISKYFAKGRLIGIDGSLQSRSYTDQQGNKRTVHEVVVDSAEFVGSRAENGLAPSQNYGQPAAAPSPFAQPAAPSAYAPAYQQQQPAMQPTMPAASPVAYQNGDLDAFQEIPDDDLPF